MGKENTEEHGGMHQQAQAEDREKQHQQAQAEDWVKQHQQTQAGDREKHQPQTQAGDRKTLRSHQDTIFSRLYSDRECILDLYFTLHPEDRNSGITPDQVEPIALRNVFLAQRHNDVAFLIGGRLIVLVEHQSTINENMPLRMLFYAADQYEKIITSFRRKLYREKRILLPRPEFYIVYTGKTPWHHKELRLSEAYGMEPQNDAPLEVRVRVICGDEMQTVQNTLGSYYHFIRFVKDNSHKGKISLQAVEDYVRQFAGSELFRGFLDKMNAEEVMKMTNYEFDLDEAKEAWKEEAMEEGMAKGIEKGIEKGIRSLMETMKFSLTQAMDALSIPPEERAIYAARIRRQ